MFHVVASTGRTATSFIAEAFNNLPDIAGCHEGHQGNDDGPDLLPLVNLENFQIYRDPAVGATVVAAKRSSEVIEEAERISGCDVVVDAAYYNAIVGEPILTAHPQSRMVGLIRDCESFVRSVTWLTGTDPMPVGWPEPGKELSTRERFISMGRVRPTEGPDHDMWPEWGAIERNIWLWRETNARLCDTKDRWPHRVVVLDFGTIKDGILPFLRAILEGLDLLERPGVDASLEAAAALASGRSNQRSGGYQIGGHETWTEAQRAMLQAATAEIEGRTSQWTQ